MQIMQVALSERETERERDCEKSVGNHASWAGCTRRRRGRLWQLALFVEAAKINSAKRADDNCFWRSREDRERQRKREIETEREK